MRVVIQRVSRASVEVDGACVGSIARGLLVLLGVGKEDTEKDAEYLSAKLTQLRIFPDEAGKMNRSLIDVGGEVLIVSQFTLFGDCSKGRRPSFERAALPQEAKRLYEYFVQKVMATGLTVATGIFQAEMTVSLVNEGPVTLILDSKSLIGK